MPRLIITLQASPPYGSEGAGGDILVPMPIDKMMDYVEICKNRLPSSLRGHNFLLCQYRWKTLLKQPENKKIKEKLSPECCFNFFVHRNGDFNNCTYFAISDQQPDSKVRDPLSYNKFCFD